MLDNFDKIFIKFDLFTSSAFQRYGYIDQLVSFSFQIDKFL